LLLQIEKLIYGGDGLARLPADDHGRGKAVFVPFVLAGEKIDATLTEQKPGFTRARADAIVEASPHRVQPPCPYFTRCGGCHYQHITYEHQLEIKKEILRENLRRIAKLELQCEIKLHPSPPWNYRNRSRLQIRTQPDFAAGYFKFASHQLQPVEECPISSPLINRGIAALWQIGRSGKMLESLRELEFFANADDTQLLVELSVTPEAPRSQVRAWAAELLAAMPEISGVMAFRQASRAAPPVATDPLVAVGESQMAYQIGHLSYRVSAGAFFQTNRHMASALIKVVTHGRSGELALDLYAGVGLFSTALACDFRHIVSVESSHLAVAALRYNLPANAEAVAATTEHYLAEQDEPKPPSVRRTGKGESGTLTREPEALALRSSGDGSSGAKAARVTPDLVVVDPPRCGLGERVARSLATLGAARLTYVACDPATLARDLVHLLAAGYHVEQAHLVDLFPQTYHIESVLHLVR
jgi:23S rRNA (uracil1939-C5)-methyltransferase